MFASRDGGTAAFGWSVTARQADRSRQGKLAAKRHKKRQNGDSWTTEFQDERPWERRHPAGFHPWTVPNFAEAFHQLTTSKASTATRRCAGPGGGIRRWTQILADARIPRWRHSSLRVERYGATSERVEAEEVSREEAQKTQKLKYLGRTPGRTSFGLWHTAGNGWAPNHGPPCFSDLR